MKKSESCPLEHDVIIAMRSDRWTDDLRAHAETCPHCRETVSVATAMRQVADRTSAELKVPVTYRILWLRAQFTRKQERLSRLDRFMLFGMFAVAATGFVVVALWKWRIVQRWIMDVSAEPGSNLPLYILAGCAALIWFLTEEVFAGER